MYWRLFRLVVVCVFVVVIGACSKGQSPAGRSLLAAHKASAGSARPSAELTQEELAILKLPLEERRRVLESKLREKLIELYGRVPDKSSAVAGKQVSDANSSGHKVEKSEFHPELNIYNEMLDLNETAEGSVWTLSFAERIEGDLNLNGEVKIEDITPLAVHFGHAWGGRPPGWPDNNDPHLDRISDHSGKIGIADITPLAQNFGKKLIGYNVYFLPYNQAGWQQSGKLLARWRLTDTGNWEDTGYPTSESFQTA